MARFRRLYFDTSILVSSNWPRISAGLERIFELCHLLRVDLVLPKPVEDELEVYWLETFRDKCRKTYNANEDVKKYVGEILEDEWALNLPSEEIAMDGYRKLMQEVVAKWKIASVPLTARNIDEVFKFAVQHHAPFAKEDKGFKDAIIYLSVIDHLAETPSVAGAFVSADKIFRDSRVGELAKSTGVSLPTYSNTDELYNELMSWLEGAMKAEWEKDKQQAEEAMKQRIEDIEKFLLETLEFSENEIGLGRRLVVVQGLKVKGIRNVKTPPLTERIENEPVKISFDTQLEVNVITERLYVAPPPSRVKVGEQAQGFSGLTLSQVLSEPRQEEQVMPWIAEVEGVSPPGDSEYKAVQFVAVRSKGSSLRDAMVRLSLESLLTK